MSSLPLSRSFSPLPFFFFQIEDERTWLCFLACSSSVSLFQFRAHPIGVRFVFFFFAVFLSLSLSFSFFFPRACSSKSLERSRPQKNALFRFLWLFFSPFFRSSTRFLLLSRRVFLLSLPKRLARRSPKSYLLKLNREIYSNPLPRCENREKEEERRRKNTMLTWIRMRFLHKASHQTKENSWVVCVQNCSKLTYSKFKYENKNLKNNYRNVWRESRKAANWSSFSALVD